MTTVTKSCLECQRPFEARTSELKRGNGKYCSRACSAQHLGRQRRKERVPNTTCAFCDTEFYRPPHRVNSKSGLYFCCREHKDKAQRITSGFPQIQPDHYGEYSSDYRKLALSEFDPECNRCGYQKHEELLEVHHKDRNRENNTIANLEILCPTCHREEHFMRQDGRWTRVPSSPRKFDPEPDQLREMIWSKPARDVATEHNISTTILRKRCREHGVERPPQGYWLKKR